MVPSLLRSIPRHSRAHYIISGTQHKAYSSTSNARNVCKAQQGEMDDNNGVADEQCCRKVMLSIVCDMEQRLDVQGVTVMPVYKEIR
jgi:hypothetical protein